mmetsp:Transcript_82397/g.191367  ORF Transcript_82397/g.191367 Transcript_82397/m.191367 type:complete len:231 (-) Transcript_82397:744-1436(-)
MRPWPSERRTNSDPGAYSLSALARYPDTAWSSLPACLRNSACVSLRSSLLMYLRKKSIVSTCDSNGRKSFGAVLSSSTMLRARERKTSLPNSVLSTSRMHISRSVKSKAPSCGQVTTFRMISLCTLLGWHMAFSCHAMSTSQMRSMARGSLRHKSILVSCASLSARKRRWQCSISAAAFPGKCSTSFRTSLRVCCTPLHVIILSRASFTTASTTPLQSPKRSSGASHLHF